jgi:hypothetical protein
MSRAIASARQRRAGISQPDPPSAAAPVRQTETQPNGLTLQQVIALVDARLLKLEKFAKDTQERPLRNVQESGPAASSGVSAEFTNDVGNVLEDFNGRFMMLAEEIADLKNTLMKLQTYTMDVNKMLLEERVNVLSDLGNVDNSMFVMEDTAVELTE